MPTEELNPTIIAGPSLVGPYERRLILERSSIWQRIGHEPLRAFSTLMREKTFARGEILQPANEPTAAAYMIVQGSVAIRNRGKPLMTIGAGGSIGFLSVVAGEINDREAIAIEPVLALALSAEQLMETFEDHFALVDSMLRGVSKGLLEMTSNLKRNYHIPADNESFPETSGPGCRTLDLVERIVFLRRTPVLGKASLDSVAELARGMHERRYAAGQVIWRPGDPSSYTLLVVHGQAKVTRDKTPTIVWINPYGNVGGLEAMSREPRVTTVTAETDLTALEMDLELVMDVMEDNFDMAAAMIGVLAQQMLVFQAANAEKLATANDRTSIE